MTRSSKKANFEIITGSYEEFLLGYYFNAKESTITQSFACHDHSSSIRTIAQSGQYLATGAADDRIFVYDFNTRKEHCMLTHHESTITSLQFTNDHTHLVSSSLDGVLAISRVGNWQLEKIWGRAHRGAAVVDVAVHSSGKLALTLGTDLTLRTWNLVKGRQAFAINLNSKSQDPRSLEKIVWAPDGVRFILHGGKFTEVWSLESGGMLRDFEHPQKVCCVVWLSDDCILVGHDDGQITKLVVSVNEKESFQAHDSRVKCLALFESWVVSVSSNGEIKVWSKEFEELAKHSTGCRLTCLCVVPVKAKDEAGSDRESEVVTEGVQVMRKETKLRSVVVEIEGSDDEGIDRKAKKIKNKKKNKRKSEEIIVEPVVKAKRKKSKKLLA